MTRWQSITHVTRTADSKAAGRECAELLTSRSDQPIQAVIVYFTLMHDPEPLLEGLAEGLPEGAKIIGSSVQGVVARDVMEEEGFVCGAIAFAGELDISAHALGEIHVETRAKGAELGRVAAETGPEGAKLSVILYDPLSSVNARTLAHGFKESAPNVPLIGAASGGPWGPIVETFQVFGKQVKQRSAVVLNISGDFDVITAASTGTQPTGEVMQVTRSEDNRILELNGQPALDVWAKAIGLRGELTLEETASWALGVERGGPGEEQWSRIGAIFLRYGKSGHRPAGGCPRRVPHHVSPTQPRRDLRANRRHGRGSRRSGRGSTGSRRSQLRMRSQNVTLLGTCGSSRRKRTDSKTNRQGRIRLARPPRLGRDSPSRKLFRILQLHLPYRRTLQ